MTKRNYSIEDADETEFSDRNDIREIRDNEITQFLTHQQTVIEIRHAGEVFGAIRNPTRSHIIRARVSDVSGEISFKLTSKGRSIDPNGRHTTTDKNA
jgi:hypothetical protein